jgi:hypothetical protein
VGRPQTRGGTGGLVDWRYVSPGYFEALRIPVLEGRPFEEKTRTRAVNLCILSRSLAQRLFPGQSAISQHLKIGTDALITIVGVVPDVKNTGLSVSDNPEYYLMRNHVPDDAYLNATGPVAQRTLSVVLRSNVPIVTLSELIRREIAELDAALPVEIEPMHQRLDTLAAGPRFNTLVLLVFAGVGLLLAAIGLYGTVAYLVTQRTREIGIRMSLGATPNEIARLMLSYSAKWTATGAAIGVLASLAATRLLSALLFHVSPRDPFTLAAAALCLFVVAIAATASPALRAARVDPVTALRSN